MRAKKINSKNKSHQWQKEKKMNKKAKNGTVNKNTKTGENIKNNRFLKTFVCIFVSIVLIFGATFSIIIAFRGANAVASYEGFTVDSGVACYFASDFKSSYLRTLSGVVPNASDSPIFWEMKSEDGTTYGELLARGTKEYISQILVGNYLFERYSTYTAEDKARVEKTVDEILNARADGSVKKFNEQTARYGFDFEDFKVGVMMIYKLVRANVAIYGTGGSNISKDTELCEKFLSEYTHVRAFFIRTETKDIYDENGKFVETVDLTAQEREEKLSRAEEVRGYISAIESGEGIIMSPQLFKSLATSYDDFNKDLQEHGYYFYKKSDSTKYFSEYWYPELVEHSYEMSIGEYSEISVKDGIWFIYKEEVGSGAYLLSSLKLFFEDFYSLAASYSLDVSLVELSKDVIITEKINSIDFISIPYTSQYRPSFS